MHFGRNIKLANLVEYKDNSLQFVKYTILGGNNKPIFHDPVYPVLENMTFPFLGTSEKYYQQVKELELDKFYIISSLKYDLNINPFFIYTDKMILKKIKNSNLNFGAIPDKAKQKVK